MTDLIITFTTSKTEYLTEKNITNLLDRYQNVGDERKIYLSVAINGCELKIPGSSRRSITRFLAKLICEVVDKNSRTGKMNHWLRVNCHGCTGDRVASLRFSLFVLELMMTLCELNCPIGLAMWESSIQARQDELYKQFGRG